MKKIKIKALRYHEFIEYEMNGPTTNDLLIAESYKITDNQREYWFITKDKSFCDRFNKKENWVHINLINGWYVGFLRNATVSGVDMMSIEQLRPMIEKIIKGQYVVFLSPSHNLIHVDRLIGIRNDAIQYVRVDIVDWLEMNDYKSISISESDFDEYMVNEIGDCILESQHYYIIDNDYGKRLYESRFAEFLSVANNLTSKPLFGTGYQIESPDGELMAFRDAFKIYTEESTNPILKYLTPCRDMDKGWEMIIPRLFYIQKLIPSNIIELLKTEGYKLIEVKAERMDCKYLVDKYLINSLISTEELDWDILNEKIPF